MIIDCHFHLDTHVLPFELLLEKKEQSGVNKIALMAPMVDPFPEPAHMLIGMLQFLLTHRPFRPLAHLLTAQFTPEGDIRILGKGYRIYKDPDNEPVFEAVRKHPDQFLGWVFVNPRGDKNPVDELQRWCDMPGFVGVKAHSFWHRYEPVELFPVAKRLAEINKPLLIHVGFGSHGDYGTLLRRVPNLKLILAHAGFPQYSDTWRVIKDQANVFVDLSQTSYVGEKTTRDVVEFLGVERCIFGTDGPYGFHGPDGLQDYGFLKRRIEKIFPDQAVQEKLFGRNFIEIAGK